MGGGGIVEHFHPVILQRVLEWASLTGANPCQMNDYFALTGLLGSKDYCKRQSVGEM